MDIMNRIKSLRKITKLSQVKFASMIGASSGNVGDWETGRSKPGSDALIAISESFNVSIDWILTGKGRGPEPNIYIYDEINPGVDKLDIITDSLNNENRILVTGNYGSGKSHMLLSFIEEMLNQERDLSEAPVTPENIIKLKDYLESRAGFENTKEMLINDSLTEDEIECLRLFNLLDEKKKQRVLGYLDSQVYESKHITGNDKSSKLVHGEEAVSETA